MIINALESLDPPAGVLKGMTVNLQVYEAVNLMGPVQKLVLFTEFDESSDVLRLLSLNSS